MGDGKKFVFGEEMDTEPFSIEFLDGEEYDLQDIAEGHREYGDGDLLIHVINAEDLEERIKNFIDHMILEDYANITNVNFDTIEEYITEVGSDFYEQQYNRRKEFFDIYLKDIFFKEHMGEEGSIEYFEDKTPISITDEEVKQILFNSSSGGSQAIDVGVKSLVQWNELSNVEYSGIETRFSNLTNNLQATTYQEAIDEIVEIIRGLLLPIASGSMETVVDGGGLTKEDDYIFFSDLDGGGLYE